ncbi:hypothetical protein HO929_08740 [Streptococcus suis]|uniref:Uncharacterized protein n=1 Tax=Streptococcus suis TaxID=1307 RepID=A0A116LPS6_STRSU|nr:hypothetical protein [Streptococcus suis]NQH32456.1 hypothetical protein [Streptococcus suis]NQH67569.1 hypothetical protein [Streptococcus suis]NQI06946.1 hypothetical protein [Streptococcus suis]NQI18238.1 hypothetical protein [Streptococcus suis]NQP01851.1 hypothetical protein [Streptococcus suis]
MKIENIEQIFERYQEKKIRLETISGQKTYVFRNNRNILDGKLIKQVIDFFANIRKRHLSLKYIRLSIFLDLGKVRIADKLSYSVLECLVYQQIVEGYSVQVYYIPETSIETKGIEFSCLNYLNPASKYFVQDKKQRESRFFKNFDIYQAQFNKYRKWISPKNTSYLSDFSSDLIYLFRNQSKFINAYNHKQYEYDDRMVKKLSNTISELVGNAIEHGQSNCLIDIDISHNFIHKDYEDKQFGAINIVILNFSKINFGDKVKNKILSDDFSNNERYQLVSDAYAIHSGMFDENYSEEVFWYIASIQDKISGRQDNFNNGGKGCTDLLKSIQEFAYLDYCYMMSGNDILKLNKNFLELDDDGFIGFNNSSFKLHMPNHTTYAKSPVYLPGVAYNLNFILEEKEK